MSQWGVFYEEDGTRHVAPVLPDGRLTVKHSLHEYCPCGPKLESENPRIIVHQDPEKGGHNS